MMKEDIAKKCTELVNKAIKSKKFPYIEYVKLGFGDSLCGIVFVDRFSSVSDVRLRVDFHLYDKENPKYDDYATESLSVSINHIIRFTPSYGKEVSEEEIRGFFNQVNIDQHKIVDDLVTLTNKI